jgi:hypothetical protein
MPLAKAARASANLPSATCCNARACQLAPSAHPCEQNHPSSPRLSATRNHALLSCSNPYLQCSRETTEFLTWWYSEPAPHITSSNTLNAPASRHTGRAPVRAASCRSLLPYKPTTGASNGCEVAPPSPCERVPWQSRSARSATRALPKHGSQRHSVGSARATCGKPHARMTAPRASCDTGQ